MPRTGNLDISEIDRILTKFGSGVLLLDLTTPSRAWLGMRNPGGAGTCALVLQLSDTHWEAIAHRGNCVLRDWEHAVKMARVITKEPRLEPELLKQRVRAGYDERGVRVGDDDDGDDVVVTVGRVPSEGDLKSEYDVYSLRHQSSEHSPGRQPSNAMPQMPQNG